MIPREILKQIRPIERRTNRIVTGSLATGWLLLLAVAVAMVGVGRLAAAESAPSAPFVYKTVGARRLTLEADFPPGWRSTDRRPVIVFFFGGGWSTGTPRQFQAQAEYFAQRGLVCLRANYRVNSRDKVLADKCVEDARSALRWVRSHAAQLGADPQRIVAAGGSAGGHLAACTFFAEKINAPEDDLSVSARPNAMILYNPVFDMVALREHSLGKVLQGLSGEVVTNMSPMYFIRQETPPTLVFDGTEDFLNAQDREFEAKCRAVGAPVEVRYTEGQPHGFFNKPPYLQQTTQTADEFLCRLGYLRSEPKVPLPSVSFRERTAKPAATSDAETNNAEPLKVQP
jgi:acetyl esterase